jgi:hypothetical protein
MGARGNAYKILVREPEGNKSLGIPRYRRVDNIKKYIKKQDFRKRTGVIWLRIRTSGRLL